MATSAGIAGVLIALTIRLFDGQPAQTVKVSKDGSFLSTDWAAEDSSAPVCNFYNASFQYTGALCSHFALARMSAAVQAEALNRALNCAAFHETDCILSPEVGLAVPAAFVYDEKDGLKMAIAPKIVSFPETTAVSRTIELRDPKDDTVIKHVEMHDSVDVEFLHGGTKSMVQQVFNGSASYCVQLLRVAIEQSCWNEID